MYTDEDSLSCIEDLCKKSRSLLALAAKTSEKINKEIRKLCLHDSLVLLAPLSPIC